MAPPDIKEPKRNWFNLFPLLLIAVLVTSWFLLGTWLISKSPFWSGTDEDMTYLGFAAAKNRWPTIEDAHRYKIISPYYPPLYFIGFAPFWGDEPVFADKFPNIIVEDTFKKGGYRYVARNFDENAHYKLDQLYRSAKYYSLSLGIIVILSLAASLRMIVRSPQVWWACLLALVPLITLPQFLYYHILANNDTLCNALGALTILCFTGAYSAVAHNRRGHYLGWLCGLAVFVGMNMLTKTTALIFVPILLWASTGIFLLNKNGMIRKAIIFLGTVLFMGVIVVLAGGWWIVYQSYLGDWNSSKIHAISHSWAVVNEPYWEMFGWTNFIMRIWRSYVGLMAGSYWEAGDITLTFYMLLYGATLIMGMLMLALFFCSKKSRESRNVPDKAMVWWFAGIVMQIAANFSGIIYINRSFLVPYGRLLFPSLVALQMLFALIWVRAVYLKPRVLVPVILAIHLSCVSLFVYELHARMVRAVLQPEEKIVTVASEPIEIMTENIFEYSYTQTFVAPPGTVQAIRIRIERTSLVPKIGGFISGNIAISGQGALPVKVPVGPVSVGDITNRFLELELADRLAIEDANELKFTLYATKPIFPFNPSLHYVACRPASSGRPSSLFIEGSFVPRKSLCFSVVYSD